MERHLTPEFKKYQKKWRQTDSGKKRRNISHWKDAGIRQPLEGWDIFWEEFKLKKKCEICNVEFNLEKHNTKRGRCLDHHHHSGYIRNVVCRKCNISDMRKFDSNHDKVLFELHRYFMIN